MHELPISIDAILWIVLVILILFSAFFSSSETAMMSLNRYRLKNMVNKGQKSAIKANNLLEHPDKLISVILIGNNLVNISAASIASVLATRLLPGNENLALVLSTVLLTLVVLVFAEVTPKTIAQKFPERVAFPAAYILKPLHLVFAPAVWIMNHLVGFILWILRIQKDSKRSDALSTEELKTVVTESGEVIQTQSQDMLLGILDLDNVTVSDIMIPRNEVVGLDLDDNIATLAEQIKTSTYTRLPVFKGDLDKVIGMLHLRDANDFLFSEKPSKVMLTKATGDNYFVPENASLHTQLINFQKEKRRMALVVDEYGDVQGLVTLEDLLEEIVGDFTRDIHFNSKDLHEQNDGSYVADGSTSIRDINKALNWNLPTEGAKTLNGLIVEQLETIPDSNISIIIDEYVIEILQINDKRVITAQLSTKKQQKALNT
ncbi:MAG: HlyC/CorC family transporter [Pseudomonadales bacterium]|nr:HlyC/CorC family transporter [Pseudomonadales bacterium]